MGFVIEPMLAEHRQAVLTIYGEGIAAGNATFQTDVPPWEAWDSGHLPHSRLVARQGEQVIGWAALSAVSSRCVYAGVAEVSIYIAAAARGQGVGKTLLRALVESSEAEGIWTLQAGIFPENTASLAIHKTCGFREVGRREKLGCMNGVWRDVLLLERRSQLVGVQEIG